MKNTSFERRFAMACVAIALVLSVLACASASTPTASTPTYHDVEYRVEGTSHRANVIYYNAQRGTEQLLPTSVPWKRKFTMSSGASLFLHAQNQRQGNRTVICQIWVDGELVRESKSSGDYAIASCSGRIGRME